MEHLLAKEGVAGSIPVSRSKKGMRLHVFFVTSKCRHTLSSQSHFVCKPLRSTDPFNHITNQSFPTVFHPSVVIATFHHNDLSSKYIVLLKKYYDIGIYRVKRMSLVTFSHRARLHLCNNFNTRECASIAERFCIIGNPKEFPMIQKKRPLLIAFHQFLLSKSSFLVSWILLKNPEIPSNTSVREK